MLVQHFQVTYVEEKLVVERLLVYLISAATLLLFVNDVFIRFESKSDYIRRLSLVY